MSRIIDEVEWPIRFVDEVEVRVTELIWSDGGRSFEVHRVDNGADLTVDGCFDNLPTDAQIRPLLEKDSGGQCDKSHCQPNGSDHSRCW